jgi:protein-tyrosine phosphatase
MPRPDSNFEQIDLKRADDPRDVVHRVVAALAQGNLVRLPTGRGTSAWAASALVPAAVERLDTLRTDHNRPLTLLARSAAEVRDWVPTLSATGQRLTRRGWPGPLEIRFHEPSIATGIAQRLSAATRALLLGDQWLCMAQPRHALVNDVLGLVHGPQVLASDARPSQDLAAGRTGDLWIDDGPEAPHDSTLVSLRGDSWQIERPGSLGQSDVQRLASTIIVFVCTGNTCRSPLAEALCRLAIAARLGCAPGEILDRGYVVASAGLAAGVGSPAAREAIEIAAARGGSLQQHASQRLSYELAATADWIVTMTDDHRQAILEMMPALAPRVRLLHSEGEDIDDPIGRGRDVYEQTAAEIERHLARFLDEIGLSGRPRRS